MTETITLVPLGGWWHARTTSPRTFELFGTDTLPTRWAASVPADEVQSEIEALNPTARVVVEKIRPSWTPSPPNEKPPGP